MTTASVLCIDCNEPVHPNRDYREITGWERIRSGGGANAIAFRQETGRWRCKDCHDMRKRGGTAAML